MKLFIRAEHRSLYNTIKLNIAITSFNNSLCGAVLWLLLGVYALPIYASLLKITAAIGDLYRCKLQEKIVENNIRYLNEKYLILQCWETLIGVIGYLLILINIRVAVVILMIETLLSSITRAYFISYTSKIDDILTGSEVVMRTKYYAVLDKVANTSSVVGTFINSLVFFLTSKFNTNDITIYKKLAIIFAIGKVIDLMCSVSEAKKVRKLYAQNWRDKNDTYL